MAIHSTSTTIADSDNGSADTSIEIPGVKGQKMAPLNTMSNLLLGMGSQFEDGQQGKSHAARL